MNVTQLARVVAVGFAVAGLALLVHAMVTGARLELVLAALGLAAGAGLIGLLTAHPAEDVVVRRHD